MNYFEAYNTSVSISEPPPILHTWTSIGTISSLLGKKCYFPMGHFNFYPNLYILLIGEAGSRKSTALKHGRDLAMSVEKIPITPASLTREALIERMAKPESAVSFHLNGKPMLYHHSSSFANEFADFIGDKHVNSNIIRFMINIWDEDKKYEYETKNKGKAIIYNPYFSFTSACTLGWIRSQLKTELISEGFARRILFVVTREMARRISVPMLTEETIRAQKFLLEDVKRIADLAGQFKLTKPAYELYDHIYQNVIPKQQEEAPDEIRPYYSSKHEMLFKVAMCISAGIDSRRIIDSHIYGAAVRLLDQVEKRFPEVYECSGRNELKEHAVRVLEELQKNPAGLTTGRILSKFYGSLNQQELSEVLNVLVKTRQVTLSGPLSADDYLYRANSSYEEAREEPLLELLSRLEPPSEDVMESFEVIPKGLLDSQSIQQPASAKLHSPQEILPTEQKKGKTFGFRLGKLSPSQSKKEPDDHEASQSSD